MATYGAAHVPRAVGLAGAVLALAGFLPAARRAILRSSAWVTERAGSKRPVGEPSLVFKPSTMPRARSVSTAAAYQAAFGTSRKVTAGTDEVEEEEAEEVVSSVGANPVRTTRCSRRRSRSALRSRGVVRTGRGGGTYVGGGEGGEGETAVGAAEELDAEGPPPPLPPPPPPACSPSHVSQKSCIDCVVAAPPPGLSATNFQPSLPSASVQSFPTQSIRSV